MIPYKELGKAMERAYKMQLNGIELKSLQKTLMYQSAQSLAGLRS